MKKNNGWGEEEEQQKKEHSQDTFAQTKSRSLSKYDIRVNKRQNLNCAYYTSHFSNDYISAQYIPQFDISAQYIPQFDNQYPRIWILGDQQQLPS